MIMFSFCLNLKKIHYKDEYLNCSDRPTLSSVNMKMQW